MKFTFFAFGAVLVSVGLILIFAGPSVVQIPIPEVKSEPLFASSNVLVGDIYVVQKFLEGSRHVKGTIQSREASSMQKAPVDLFVFDEASYRKWSTGASADAVYKITGLTDANVTFSVGRDGEYFFVFDNRNSVFKRSLSYSFTIERTITTMQFDTRVNYLAYLLVIVGAVACTYGLLSKKTIPWA